MTGFRWRRAAITAVALAALSTLGFGFAAEIRTSWLQSELLSSVAPQLSFVVQPGPSPSIRFPKAGPYDQRLGYVDLPGFVERLSARGFTVEQQARLSRRHREVIDRGAYPIFHEKTQAGLSLLDHRGAVVFDARHPGRVYPSFEAIPPLVVDALLFIENRELLDAEAPRRNPAIEWDRLAAVAATALARHGQPNAKLPGASTLATQIEKYRHAQDGRTEDARAKLRQMVSASLRAYLDGPDTTAARRRIVVDYLNSTPLSARAGFGEVNGLGDGLFAWFGTDFDHANQILTADDGAPKAQIFKQALSLLLAQRRPSHYLLAGRADLRTLADRHLRLLVAEGVIDAALGRLALDLPLDFLPDPRLSAGAGYIGQKAANAVRRELLSLLGVQGLYQLDRLDLSVETSLDLPTQERVTDLLRRLTDPAVARDLGLYGHRLLDPGKSGDSLIYSLTLYERGAGANHLRVQADNLDQPFDMNQGAKLDLGSTAKLRTLISYLEIVAELHARLAPIAPGERQSVAAAAGDPLTRWAADRLASGADRSLAALLEAAMARRYSASPGERFYTGGGVHQFANFDPDDNDRVVTVAQAFRHSVNLPFIRMMRDIVRYHQTTASPAGDVLTDRDHPLRDRYLEQFADREGRTFLNRFFDELRGLDAEGALDRLARQAAPRAERLAVVYRSVRPNAGLDEFAGFLRAHLERPLSEREIDKLYRTYAIDRFSLADRGYLARQHPLKLWLVAYLQKHADPTRAAVLAASDAERRASYDWLFKTSRKRAQDQRIGILLEAEAFGRIHRSWQRLGYPFDSLVPSYATAIGSSADRPEALAELIGIILNDGVWQPAVRAERLHFAAGTPYETVLGLRPAAARRVLPSEIAAIVRKALIDVVDAGTARRLHGAFASGEAPLVVGAKTGTGDHRKKSFDAGGRLTHSQAVSRTATVVFFIGDDFFGNLTVYSAGPESADFGFTSSLPAQLLKAIAPALQPLLDRGAVHALRAPSAPAKDHPRAGGLNQKEAG